MSEIIYRHTDILNKSKVTLDMLKLGDIIAYKEKHYFVKSIKNKKITFSKINIKITYKVKGGWPIHIYISVKTFNDYTANYNPSIIYTAGIFRLGCFNIQLIGTDNNTHKFLIV